MSIYELENPKGVRTGIEEGFIAINDGVHDFFGGRQQWFPSEYRPKVREYGCGIVAAVNTYLYLRGIRRLSKHAYLALVEEYIIKYPSSKWKMNFGFGVFPWQMIRYIKAKCGLSHILVKAGWKGYAGVERQYDLIKESLQKDIPVIWGIYSLKHRNKLKFYTYKNGRYHLATFEGINSHYVTITAVYENEEGGNLSRWVEISSWGERYFVNYDEYKAFVKNRGGWLNPSNWVNSYCSNIIFVDKR